MKEDKDINEILPNAILLMIFSFLTLEDLKNCALVCKLWGDFANESLAPSKIKGILSKDKHVTFSSENDTFSFSEIKYVLLTDISYEKAIFSGKISDVFKTLSSTVAFFKKIKPNVFYDSLEQGTIENINKISPGLIPDPRKKLINYDPFQ